MKNIDMVNTGINIEKKTDYINVGLLLLSVFFILAPFRIESLIPYSYRIVVLVLWYIDVFFRDLHGFKQFKGLVVISAIFYLYEFFCFAIGFSTASIGNYFNLFIYYDIIIKAFYVYYRYSPKLKIVLTRGIQIGVLIALFYNITYSAYMELLFDIGGGKMVYDEFGMLGGHTNFYNMLIYFNGANFYLLLKEERRLFKLLDIACLLVALYFMLSFNTRATSLSFTVLLCSVIFVSQRLKNVSFVSIAKKFLFIGIILIIAFFVFDEFIIEVLPERVANRLQAIVNVSQGSDYRNSSMLSRVSLSLVSVDTWLSSIETLFLGAGYHVGVDYWDIIGQHALYPDMLAKYGILGFSMLFVCLFQIFKNINKLALPPENMIPIYSIFICYLLAGFFSDSRDATVVTSVFLFPIMVFSSSIELKK